MMNIRPFFSHYIGFDEEAHAIFALNSTKFGTPTVPFLFVGTNFGRCLLFSSLSLKQVAALYEDAERRQIVAIGRWPFAEEIKKVSSDCIIIWLHFRCHSIALFELIVDNDFFRLRSLRELSTGHYGFCHALSDPVGGRMFIPDHEELSSSLRICYRTGGEKVLVLGEQFMKKSWARRTKGCSSTAPDLEEAMFKGLIMGVEVISQDQLLLVFEDSTVCAFNLHTNAVIDALKHPKRPEFLCWSVLPLPLSSSADGISPLGALVAVSVIGQLYLLNYCSTGFDDEANGEAEQQLPTPPPTHKQLLRAECKVKQCKRDFECTALAFCDNSKQQQQQSVIRLASGFKNGTIEIRSVFMAPSVGDEKWHHRRWTTTLLAKCDFHTCAIRVLSSLVDVVGCVSESSPSSVVNFHQKDSSNIPHFNVGQCSPPSSPQHLLLISGASDGKISLFVLCQ